MSSSARTAPERGGCADTIMLRFRAPGARNARRRRILTADASARRDAGSGDGRIAAGEPRPRTSAMILAKLANPSVFLRWSGAALPFIAGAAAVLSGVGLYMAWFVAPADYQQGETVRIMFLHVPAAWLALFFYALMAASAIGTLVWRHPLADVSQKAAAPDRRRLHADLPRHRRALGQADVGRLLGVGRAPHLRACALPHVLRHTRAVADDRGSEPRRPRRVDPDAGRLREPCRSSSSRSIGGTPCTSRPRCSASKGRRSTLDALPAPRDGRSPSR